MAIIANRIGVASRYRRYNEAVSSVEVWGWIRWMEPAAMRLPLVLSLVPSLVLILSSVLCAAEPADRPATRPAGPFTLWAIDEMTRINPETGKAFEENPQQRPGGLAGGYRAANSVWSEAKQVVDLAGARNEVVAFQLIIEGAGEGYTVQATPLAGAAGKAIPLKNIRLFREWYIEVGAHKPMKGSYTPLAAGWYPDVCIPLGEPKYGNGFSIPSKDFHDPEGKRFPDQKNQAIWVDIHIPAGTAAGTYTGTIAVRNGQGASKSVNVRLKVWDFQIPAEMNMLAHFVNYGATIREADPDMMLAYYRLAMEHRAYINDDKAPTFSFDGREFDWKQFDAKFGPFLDGTAFTEGPTAGQAIPAWPFPIEFHIRRPDKPHIGDRTPKDWPLPIEKTADGLGVVMTEQYKKDLVAVLKKVEDHFSSKGWTKTRLTVFQDSLDEPGFHKSGAALEAGRQQARIIHDTAALVKRSGLKQFRYRFDVGSGFINNNLDLDGDGKAEGPIDVVKYFGPVVDLWYIHGLCVEDKAVRLLEQLNPDAVICFYNGFQPRVASNAINGELLGFRQWGVAAWLGGLDGWVDWQFRLENDFMGEGARKTRQVWYELQDSLHRNLYLYRGEQIGLPGKVFASMRLKSARRGIQDYEMLRLLAGRDVRGNLAETLALQVCSHTFRNNVGLLGRSGEDDAPGERAKTAGGFGKGHYWSHDPAAWERFRRSLGEALAGTTAR